MRYAKGRRAFFICQRSGRKTPYKYLVIEPGTNLMVDRRESDGYYNIVDHPQNYSFKDFSDPAPLEHISVEADPEAPGKIEITVRGETIVLSDPDND